MEEYVIDSIVEHKTNKSRRHRYLKYSENLYRMRWYGFKSDEDTNELIKKLPRMKVLRYCKRKKIAIRDDIGKANNA